MDGEVQQLVAMTKEALAEAIKNIAGKDGLKMAEKISNANNTPEGLQAAAHQCQQIAKLTIEDKKFNQLKSIFEDLQRDLGSAVAALSDGSDTSQQDRKIRMVKAKLITIASRVFGNGADGLKITNKLRNAPESVEGLKGSLKECEKLASLTTDPIKVKTMKLNSEKIMEEIT